MLPEVNVVIITNPLLLSFRWASKHLALSEVKRVLCSSTTIHCKLQLNNHTGQKNGLCRSNSKSCFPPSFGCLSTNVIFRWLTFCWCCLCNYKKLSILFPAIIYFTFTFVTWIVLTLWLPRQRQMLSCCHWYIWVSSITSFSND